MTIYQEGWCQSTGEDDEPSMTSKAIYKFGLDTANREIPINIPVNFEVNETTKLGSLYAEHSKGNQPIDSITSMCIPTNGIDFYSGLGSATHTITNQKQTIQHMTTGRKPRYHVTSQAGDNNPYTVYSVYWHDLSWKMVRGAPVTLTKTGKGLTSVNTDYTLETPTYPSNQDDFFNIMEYFKWGADGSEETINNMLSIEFKITQTIVGYIGDSGQYIKFDDWSNPILCGFSIGLEGENKTLTEDWKAGTSRSCLWKVSKSSNSDHYFEVDSNGATAFCESHTAVMEKGAVIGWNATFVLDNPIITVQDYLSDSFYEIPT